MCFKFQKVYTLYSEKFPSHSIPWSLSLPPCKQKYYISRYFSRDTLCVYKKIIGCS